MTKPTLPIAVVIPAYDAATDLPGALATVRAQTVHVEEIIVVDDGSHDDSATIAEALGATVVRQANAGCGPARNTAIRAARAPWIALLDADDRWEPSKLARQWEAARLDAAVRMVSCDYATFEGERLLRSGCFAALENYAVTPKTRLAPRIVEFSAAALAVSLPAGQFLAPSSILVERKLVMEGTFFAPSPHGSLFHVSEDIEWYLRALRETNVIVVEEALVRYMTGAPSLSSSGGRMHYGMLKLADMIAEHPERYADGSGTGFARDRSRRMSMTILSFLRALDFESADAVLAEFRQERTSPELEMLGMLSKIFATPALQPALRAARARRRARGR